MIIIIFRSFYPADEDFLTESYHFSFHHCDSDPADFISMAFCSALGMKHSEINSLSLFTPFESVANGRFLPHICIFINSFPIIFPQLSKSSCNQNQQRSLIHYEFEMNTNEIHTKFTNKTMYRNTCSSVVFKLFCKILYTWDLTRK